MAVQEMEKEIQEAPEIELNMKELGLEDSSPRGVLEIPVMSTTDSDHSTTSSCSSCSPEKSTITRTVSANNDNHRGLHWNKMFETIRQKSVRRFSVIPLLASYELRRKNSRKKTTKPRPSDRGSDVDCDQILVSKPSWRNFSYEELTAATDDFNPDNMIGKGGHAEVYKGLLPDGETVAIKRLSCHVKEREDRVCDFLSELGILAHVSHPNAARLLGFSTDQGLHFVLELSPHGTLASLLFGSEECLEWKIRFKVIVGIAEGLCYLHQDCQRRIIHRDIKASNILLTQDYEAQISDFGLAKWLPENWPHHVVHPVEGTFGYMAPEYFMHGIVNEKTDVFAFGVLLLEIITGRRAIDTASRQSLVMWTKPFLEQNSVSELVDTRLGRNFDTTEMKRVMLTASMCVHHLAPLRPHMSRVLKLLTGEDGPPELQQKPAAGGRAVMLDGSDLQDYTCTNYLNDLNRHMQLVME